MAKPTFTRKILANKGSLLVTIPQDIAEALKLKKGDSLVFTYENGSFTCSKMKQLAD